MTILQFKILQISVDALSRNLKGIWARLVAQFEYIEYINFHEIVVVVKEYFHLIWLRKTIGKYEFINPSIYNIIRWVAWTMGQMNRQPSVWCSKYYLFFMISCKILCKNPFNLFSYFFITKIKIKSFECHKSIKSIRKVILGTSDSWLTIHLSHRPSNHALYIAN